MSDDEQKPINQNYDELKAIILSMSADYDKFKNKNIKASGQRVRASLLQTKKLCDTIRKQLKEEINKTKKPPKIKIPSPLTPTPTPTPSSSPNIKSLSPPGKTKKKKK